MGRKVVINIFVVNEELYNDFECLQSLFEEEQFANKALKTKCDLLEELNKQLKAALHGKEIEIKNLNEDMRKILAAHSVILKQAS